MPLSLLLFTLILGIDEPVLETEPSPPPDEQAVDDDDTGSDDAPSAYARDDASLYAQALRAEDDGRPAEALVLLRRAAAEKPDDPAIAFDLARVAVALASGGGRPDVGDVRPFVRLSPKSSEARLLRAYLLAERFNLETSVATRGAVRLQNDTPGVVSVVTRKEILESGARDLIDVLQGIAGFAFGTDVVGGISPAFRGLWGAEGKILVLLDGHELHELSYLTNYLGNRVSLDWIERIEVIRGPGSVVYGGAAEIAVVSITTRTAADLTGGSVAVSYGQMSQSSLDGSPGDAFSRRNLSASFGQVFDKLGELSVKGDLFIGQGNRSDLEYRDLRGDAFDMDGIYRFPDGHTRRNAANDPMMADLAVSWQGYELRYLFEDWRQTDRTGSGTAILSYPIPIEWRMHSLQLKKTWSLPLQVEVTPHLLYVWQNPWRTLGADAAALDRARWNPHLLRVQPGVLATWAPVKGTSLMLGGEYTFDKSTDAFYGYPDPAHLDDANATVASIQFHNLAGFAEALIDTDWANLTAGARYEHNSELGDTFLPRLAVTRAFGPFHLKGLYSRAMRVPNIENLGLRQGVRPEHTTVFEVEAGVVLADALYLGLNGYDVTIADAIIYGFDPNATRAVYSNGATIGTRGLEAEARLKTDLGWANVAYSYYDARGKNWALTTNGKPNPYVVPGHEQVLAGLAPHKLTLAGALELTRSVIVSPSASWTWGDRWAFAGSTATGAPILRRYGGELLLNLVVTRRDVGTRGVFVAVGGYNLANQKQLFVQPYRSNGQHAPVPGPSLEVMLTVGYDSSRAD
jgi:outer membrane receptor protein involved in Fe transport